MSPTEEEHARAVRAYDAATETLRGYHRQNDIRPLDRSVKEEAEELDKGVRFKCLTPDAKMALARWQLAKLDLDATHAAVRRERGDFKCPVCP